MDSEKPLSTGGGSAVGVLDHTLVYPFRGATTGLWLGIFLPNGGTALGTVRRLVAVHRDRIALVLAVAGLVFHRSFTVSIDSHIRTGPLECCLNG